MIVEVLHNLLELLHMLRTKVHRQVEMVVVAGNLVVCKRLLQVHMD